MLWLEFTVSLIGLGLILWNWNDKYWIQSFLFVLQAFALL